MQGISVQGCGGTIHWVGILWVDTGIVTIPLFKIDVPLSSKCIGFGSKSSRMETDYEVESGKVFGPLCLLT